MFLANTTTPPVEGILSFPFLRDSLCFTPTGPWGGSPGQCLAGLLYGEAQQGGFWFPSLPHPAADSHGEAWGTEGPWG